MPSKLLASTSTKSKFLIIIAHSARAIAESASRAGYKVVTIDGFADLDTLQVSLECWCLPLVNGAFLNSKLQQCINKVHTRYPAAKIILGAGAESLASVIESIEDWELVGSSSSCIQRFVIRRSFLLH